METYLRVSFHSDGGKPSEVSEHLKAFGFVPTQGNYDFVYDWAGAATREQILDLSDEVSRLLRGYRVLFEIETV
jgi:hypothetical protein